MTALPEDFFQAGALDLAVRLLNTELVRLEEDGSETAGRIVEVEAYAGPEDRAAHSYGNRRTARTEAMYGPAGRAYIFRIYGMHLCFNVVAAAPGQPEAVLVRALEPRRGLERMAERRGMAEEDGRGRKPHRLKELANGPAKLCQALGIRMQDYGADLTRPPLFLRLLPPEQRPDAADIAMGPRVNVDYAGEWTEKPWRFWLLGNPFVSCPHGPITATGDRCERVRAAVLRPQHRPNL